MKTTAHSELHDTDWPAAIVTHLLDAVVAIDEHGIVRYLNPSAAAITGHDASAAPGNPVSNAFLFYDRASRKPLALPTPHTFEDRSDGRTASVVWNQVLFAPPHREELIVNAIFTPIPREEHSIAGVVMRFRDVSQNVQMERKERDKQKIQAISTLAGSIASEFTNWLSLISGHAAAIVDNLIPRTRAYEEAVQILDATKRAGGLTKRLLSIARSGNGNDTIAPKPVHLDAVIRSAVSQAQSTFKSPDITFRVVKPARLPMVMADSTHLTDCFMNLFRNACDAMPNGGTITIDFPASGTSAPRREFVIVRVRDSGRGMKKEVLDRAFEPFFSTKDPMVAIGLGLTVVRTSVEQWGGMVKIRSRPGHGASVRIFLRQAHTAHTDARRETTRIPAADVLIVDDQPAVLNDLSVLLESAGYRTHKTANAEECLALYRQHADEIDLLIIDVVMPGTDGKSVLDDVLSINPQANVIMMSGFSRDYVRNYLKKGAWGFVQKPLDQEHLISTVERSLEGAQA